MAGTENSPIPNSEYIGGAWAMQRNFVSLINEAAGAEDIAVDWLSEEWIAKLTKEGVTHFITGTAFPLNNAVAANIAADKVSTSAVLTQKGVAAIPHYLIRVPSTGELEGAADNALAHVQAPMVIKPAGEAGGLDVHKAETPEEAQTLISRLAPKYRALAVSPFETIVHEHRVVMLDGEPQLFYSKQLPDNTREWRHNLKYGAIPIQEASPEVCAALAKLAIAAMEAIDARFMTVDIATLPEDRKVLEINSGVMLDRFAKQNPEYRALAIRIYQKALRKCFE